MVVHNLADKKSFDEKVIKAPADQLVVLDCFATWCGPCKMIAEPLAKLSNQHENAGFYKFDVDEVPDLAQELGIRAMPTILFFKNGEKVEEVVGANMAAITKNLASLA